MQPKCTTIFQTLDQRFEVQVRNDHYWGKDHIWYAVMEQGPKRYVQHQHKTLKAAFARAGIRNQAFLPA